MRKFITITSENKDYTEQCAALLSQNFSDFNDYETALNTTKNCISDNKINILYVDNNEVIGWISGAETYNIHVWEIQPIVIKKQYQKQGIGRLLLNVFENAVKERNGLTVILGTQDDGTSLHNTNIYENMSQKIADIKNLNNNPYEFYIKCGYTIVGVIPDSGVRGNNDILMAKKIV